MLRLDVRAFAVAAPLTATLTEIPLEHLQYKMSNTSLTLAVHRLRHVWSAVVRCPLATSERAGCALCPVPRLLRVSTCKGTQLSGRSWVGRWTRCMERRMQACEQHRRAVDDCRAACVHHTRQCHAMRSMRRRESCTRHRARTTTVPVEAKPMPCSCLNEL